MKSPISLPEKQQTKPIKAKMNLKKEENNHLFQQNEVNHDSLNEEMKWLESLIDMRCKELFLEDEAEVNHKIPEAPKLDNESPYSITVNTHHLSDIERVILALGVASAHYPSVLKTFVQIEESSNAFAIEAGGEYNKANRSFKPTFQTALFLLSGKDLSLWSHYSAKLIIGSVLLKNDIVYNRSYTEFIHGKIELDSSYLNYFCRV